jgi:hypothetical protein
MNIIHQYSEKQYLGKWTVQQILENIHNIDNWEYNRPADLERSKKIAESISEKKTPIDWVFYVSYHTAKNTFYIVDGIHRLYAIQMAYKRMENKEWLLQQTVILNIRVDPTNGEIIDWFQAINNSNPVPELYLRDTTQDKRNTIEKIMREWQDKYPEHFMPTKKPISGHINRDRFMDILDQVYERYAKTNHKLTPIDSLLREKLVLKNEWIQQNLPKKISAKIMEKCEKSGCYLFLQKFDWLCDNI